jgi:hypothetical protein
MRQVIALGPNLPQEYEIAVKVLNYADDVNLSRIVLDAWEAKDPKNQTAIRLRYAVEMKGKNPSGALEAAKKGEKLAPKDDSWKQLYQKAAEKLREELKAAGQGD